MKSKVFKSVVSSVIAITIVLIGIVVYKNYFINNFYVEKYTKEEKINVFDEYKNEKLNICYGNKLKCKNLSYEIKGNVDTKKVGKYDIEYIATYKKKKVSYKKEVIVVDETAPELIVEADLSNVCPNGKINNTKLSAIDNYDGDITKNIKYKIENNKIQYVVEDSSNNKTVKEFDITYKDNKAPDIILSGENVIYITKNSKYTEKGYSSIDFCDGDVTSKVKVTNNIDTSKPGDYYVNYESIDSSGNKNVVKRTIRVYEPKNIDANSTGSKVVYLTFDDGPGAYTEKLLNILAKYNVKVTFFVIGTNTKYDNLITREYNEGHTVGLHCYNHNYNVIYASDEAYYNDLNKISNKVKTLTGSESKIIRFPGGSSNTVSRHYSKGIMSRLTKSVEQNGYKYFDWNISSGDAGSTTSSDRVYQNVINGFKPNRSNIVLMHDIKSYTVNAVERIIQYGIANGYTFAPLTMNSPTIHQNVGN